MSLPKYRIELDAADLDAIYHAIAAPHHDLIGRRLGVGVQQRALQHLHSQMPTDIPSPRTIRGLLRDEDLWAVAEEPK
jgi:hypothetical protein